MDHDHGNDRTPATKCAIGIKPVAVSLSNARFPCRKYKKRQVRDEESALKQLAGHDHALDLVGALVDLGVVGPSRLSSGLTFVIVCLTSGRTDGW
jgi:hypothetical protein